MGSVLLAVDPGIRGCGCAVFRDGHLVDARYVVNPVRRGNDAAAAASMASWVFGELRRYKPDKLALEWPVVYYERIKRGEEKRDPNDLLALTGVDTGIAVLFSPATAYTYRPAEWKGQLKKDAMLFRIQGRLGDGTLERNIAEDGASNAEGGEKTRGHNVWDAVGIGLYHLGRLDRVRIIPT